MFLSVASGAQDSLVVRKMFNDKIELLVPRTFRELTKEQIAAKFPDAGSRPAVVWTADDESSGIRVMEMPEDVSDQQVPEYQTFHVRYMKQEPDQEWISDGVRKINGRNVGFVKVVHTDINTYAHYFFVSIDGRLVQLAYHCTGKLRPSLESVGDKIAASLKVK